MLVCDYIVERIDGDYAMLKRTDMPEEELRSEEHTSELQSPR